MSFVEGDQPSSLRVATPSSETAVTFVVTPGVVALTKSATVATTVAWEMGTASSPLPSVVLTVSVTDTGTLNPCPALGEPKLVSAKAPQANTPPIAVPVQSWHNPVSGHGAYPVKPMTARSEKSISTVCSAMPWALHSETETGRSAGNVSPRQTRSRTSIPTTPLIMFVVKSNAAPSSARHTTCPPSEATSVQPKDITRFVVPPISNRSADSSLIQTLPNLPTEYETEESASSYA